jgi:hypothetical protein
MAILRPSKEWLAGLLPLTVACLAAGWHSTHPPHAPNLLAEDTAAARQVDKKQPGAKSESKNLMPELTLMIWYHALADLNQLKIEPPRLSSAWLGYPEFPSIEIRPTNDEEFGYETTGDFMD